MLGKGCQWGSQISLLFCWTHKNRPKIWVPIEHSPVFMSNRGNWRSLRLPNLDSSALVRETHILIKFLSSFVCLSHSTLQNSQHHIYSQSFSPNMNICLCFILWLHFFVLLHSLLHPTYSAARNGPVLRGSVSWKKHWAFMTSISSS